MQLADGQSGLYGEAMEEGTSTPSEIAVIGEVNFRKRNEAVGPNELSSSFFMDGGKVVISELKKSWDRSEKGRYCSGLM